MLATLHNCLGIFASNHEVVLYLAMTQRHGNEGAQQIACPSTLRFGNLWFLIIPNQPRFHDAFDYQLANAPSNNK